MVCSEADTSLMIREQCGMINFQRLKKTTYCTIKVITSWEDLTKINKTYKFGGQCGPDVCRHEGNATKNFKFCLLYILNKQIIWYVQRFKFDHDHSTIILVTRLLIDTILLINDK